MTCAFDATSDCDLALSMKILVTGSSGTIGTRLCEQLILDGHHVVGADYVPNQWNSKVNDATIVVDLRDVDAVLACLPTDVDIIIHLAANARVHNLVVEPALARDNIETTFNMIEFARTRGIGRFIFASSREVYGNTDAVVHSEDDAITRNSESPYTASKVSGEALVHSYHQCYDIEFIIVRFSNVYGMYDFSDRVVPKFIRLCEANEDLVVFGEDKVLDFTYISDAVDAIGILLKEFESQKNEVFNVASGVGTSILHVAELIKSGQNSLSSIVVEPSRIGEVVRYTADISKICERTFFTPKVNIEEGINLALQWYSRSRGLVYQS